MTAEIVVLAALLESSQSAIFWNQAAVRAGETPGAANAKVIVAVLDTGIVVGRGLFDEAKILPGYDFVNGDQDPADDNGHGADIASLIIGSSFFGIEPLCPECLILPVKVLDQKGEGLSQDVARGIHFAVDRAARVINISFGICPGYGSSDLKSAVRYALDRGVLVVASVGNEGKVEEPARFEGVLAVGAFNSALERTDYTSFSSRVDILGPGGDRQDRNSDGSEDAIFGARLLGPDQRPGLWPRVGTSQAAAHVSALASRLVAYGARPGQARQVILASASLPSENTSPGLVDFKSAFDYWLTWRDQLAAMALSEFSVSQSLAAGKEDGEQ